MSENLKAALWYANNDWLVFPCHGIKDGKCTCGDPKCESQGKHPLTKNGVKDATTDTEIIGTWFKKWPWANVAIATGKESNLIVVDIDPRHEGLISLKKLEDTYVTLPPTPTVSTGGDGLHYYFSYPKTIEIKNAVNIQPGIDVRSDGGYVVAPPSNHLSGKNYEWKPGQHPSDIGLAPYNRGWFMADEKEEEKKEQQTRIATGVLKGVVKGQRDDTLFHYACKLRAQGLSKEETEILILTAANACKPKFPEEDARRKIESAWKYSPSMTAMLLQVGEQAPEIQGEESTYKVHWGENEIGIWAAISSLKEHTNGDITGFVAWSTNLPGTPPKLHQAKFNFVTTRTRSELARTLHERAPALIYAQWLSIIESLCDAIITQMHEGDSCIVLDPENASSEPIHYILRPFLIEKAPVAIFGEKTSGKSYMAQMLAYLAQLGEGQDRLKLFSESRAQKVLYLSWEDEGSAINYRLHSLSKGLGLPFCKMLYRFCFRPLFADVDRLRRIIIDNDVDLVIIDSLGPASGGDLNSPQPAIDFYNALRSLKISSLIVAHTAKNVRKKSSIYGNVYFGNLARSIWEVVGYQDPGDTDLHIGLFHRNANFTQKEAPVGFKFTFDDNKTTVALENVQKMPGMEDKIGISAQIYNLLLEMGKLTSGEIMSTLGQNQGSVSSALNRLKNKKKIIKLTDHRWGILVNDELGF